MMGKEMTLVWCWRTKDKTRKRRNRCTSGLHAMTTASQKRGDVTREV
jgi:hypothetical protein